MQDGRISTMFEKLDPAAFTKCFATCENVLAIVSARILDQASNADPRGGRCSEGPNTRPRLRAAILDDPFSCA